MEGIASGAVVLVSGSVRDAIVVSVLIGCTVLVLKTSSGPVVLKDCVSNGMNGLMFGNDWCTLSQKDERWGVPR